ncbi:MAG: hypothetical protein EXX96DRAFT_622870 [Benjaminiella poitrasii]|nr:MAG: hypothetical protein EXX96DRAFT_622870 [Benjaminiella poitrasii]
MSVMMLIPRKLLFIITPRKIFDLTHRIATEIHGLQLSKLTYQQKNNLAMLIAERGVVFFRDQDINPYQGKELGAYYRPLYNSNLRLKFKISV